MDRLAICPLELPHHLNEERRAEYCCLMTGQENERGAPYSTSGQNVPRCRSVFVLKLQKEDAMADSGCKEEYTYQVGKITFIVTPVYKDEGEPMRDILLRLMLADLEPA